MIDVFLSASVPLPTRDRKFFDTADVLLIREAIKSLVEVLLPVGRITCGGHPAITPLLSLFSRQAGLDVKRVVVFQSAFFEDQAPAALGDFVDIRTTPSGHDRASSLTAMRTAMVASRKFKAAVFIGGMDGIFEEAQLFESQHPNAEMLPIASTGAAAAMLFARGGYDDELKNELTYSSLFRHRLLEKERPAR